VNADEETYTINLQNISEAGMLLREDVVTILGPKAAENYHVI